MTTADAWHLEHSYLELPEPFYAQVEPVPVNSPRQVVFNDRLAEVLGLDLSDVSTD